MLADSEQNPARRGLAPHEGRRDDQNDQDRVTGCDVFLADPDLNYRPAENKENGGDRQCGECAEAVPGHKYFAQAFHIAGGFGLAGDGHEILRQRHDDLLRIVYDERTEAEIRDRGRRDHRGDHDIVAFELELCRDHDDQGDTAVVDDGPQGRSVNVLEAEGNRADAVGNHSPQHGDRDRSPHRNGGNRKQPSSLLDGQEDQNQAREVTPMLAQLLA